MIDAGRYWFMVFSNPSAGQEAEYEDWYDNVHFPDLLSIPGFVAGQRFRLTEAQARPGEHPHKFLVVWEIATDDLAGVFDQIHRRRADGRVRLSLAYDRSTAQTHTYEPVTARIVADVVQSETPRPTSDAQLSNASGAMSRQFCLRRYRVAPGKLPALLDRFEKHAMRIFERHGLRSIGYWTDSDESSDGTATLAYLLCAADAAAYHAGWLGFRTDPEWAKIKAETEKDGKFVLSAESRMLSACHFSPIQ